MQNADTPLHTLQKNALKRITGLIKMIVICEDDVLYFELLHKQIKLPKMCGTF